MKPSCTYEKLLFKCFQDPVKQGRIVMVALRSAECRDSGCLSLSMSLRGAVSLSLGDTSCCRSHLSVIVRSHLLSLRGAISPVIARSTATKVSNRAPLCSARDIPMFRRRSTANGHGILQNPYAAHVFTQSVSILV